jgi:hypothetical protein
METKLEYTVLKEHSLSELIDQVNRMIGLGWLPLGGFFTSADSDEHHYYQAMTRNLTQSSV